MIIDKILKAPLVLLVIASFLASVYVYLRPIPSITIIIATPISLGVIIVLYFLGSYLKWRKNGNRKINSTDKIERVGDVEANNTSQ